MNRVSRAADPNQTRLYSDRQQLFVRHEKQTCRKEEYKSMIKNGIRAKPKERTESQPGIERQTNGRTRFD
jgi:hypothetical protein